MIRNTFAVLEEAAVAGHGIATWAGLEKEVFTVGELLALAADAADRQRHHRAAVQLPVSLPGMVGQEFADLIRPGLTPAQAWVLAVASCPRRRRPHRRFECTTREGGGRSRRSTLPDRR
ncbi:hypothetical protein [Streptomyces antibioticus]|uniref:hypothetical protein n=1 Tax=Streptomyces antibioticus TaxID=1890 RepID=UPI0036D76FF0